MAGAEPKNLSDLRFPENEDLTGALIASSTRSLSHAEWKVLFANRDLFPVINSTTIPAVREGLYRVDCGEYLDRNKTDWDLTFNYTLKAAGDLDFQVEISQTNVEEWQFFTDDQNINRGVRVTTTQNGLTNDEFAWRQFEEGMIKQGMETHPVLHRWVVKQTEVFPVTFVHYFWQEQNEIEDNENDETDIGANEIVYEIEYEIEKETEIEYEIEMETA